MDFVDGISGVATGGDSVNIVGRLTVAAASAMVGLVGTWAVYQWGGFDHAAGRQQHTFAYATNAAPRVESSAALWLLSVGVSRYADSALALDFADLDAQAVAGALQAVAQIGQFDQFHSLVLTNEQVTRESMLGSLADFLGAAGPNDVAMLFVAGHGVRDLRSGGFYFLPYPANADNLLTEGLRMSDFDELLRIVRRNVRAVVVMLDTCHAGALKVPSMQLESTDEIASQISAGEGFFLIAASRPGEESIEISELGHGAFTYALLEALRGAGDTNGDGRVSVSELFGHVATRVPQLTGGRQHPYHKIEGTDVALFDVAASAARQPTFTLIPRASPTAELGGVEKANTIGVMDFQNLRADVENEWIQTALRVAFNTELSKVKALRVFSPELIDRTARRKGADALSTARELGIGRLVTGSFHVTGDTLRIDARLVDAGTGVNEASDSVEGELSDFFGLQKRLVLSMLRRLRVRVSAEEGASIETETNTDVDAYRLLLQAEGIVENDKNDPPSGDIAPAPQSSLHHLRRWLPVLVPPARAQETLPPARSRTDSPPIVPAPDSLPGSQEPDLDQQAEEFLDRYRAAVEAKDLEAVAALYVSFSDNQRKALENYFRTAVDLQVDLTDPKIERQDGGLLVTFTRHDRFIDTKSGRPVRLEVRLSKNLLRKDGEWKIGGKK